MPHSWNFHKGKRKDAKTTDVKEKGKKNRCKKRETQKEVQKAAQPSDYGTGTFFSSGRGRWSLYSAMLCMILH